MFIIKLRGTVYSSSIVSRLLLGCFYINKYANLFAGLAALSFHCDSACSTVTGYNEGFDFGLADALLWCLKLSFCFSLKIIPGGGMKSMVNTHTSDC